MNYLLKNFRRWFRCCFENQNVVNDKKKDNVLLQDLCQSLLNKNNNTIASYNCYQNEIYYLFVVDIDDTLISTTEICEMGYGEVPSLLDNVQLVRNLLNSKGIDALEYYVYQLLDTLSTYGQVILLSNARSSWIHVALNILYPNIASQIHNYCSIMSARDTFENQFPGTPIKWKEAAATSILCEYLDNFNNNNNNNNNNKNSDWMNKKICCITIGDQKNDHDCIKLALENMSIEKSRLFEHRTIELAQKPSIETMYKQLQEICHAWSLEYFLSENSQ